MISFLIVLFLLRPLYVSSGWQQTFPDLHHINTWHYPDLEQGANTTYKPNGRIWDREMLKSATSYVNYAALGPMLEKLDRGERVVIAALGSSQVADFSGCWGDISLVRETVETLHSTYASHKCGSAVDAEGRLGFLPGWGHGLMLFINKTWPNPRHVFVNIGSGGYTFYSYADQGCLDSHIPRQPDLLILEQNERGVKDAGQLNRAESFLWRLTHHFRFNGSTSPVPVVMLSTIAVAPPYSPQSKCMEGGRCPGKCSLPSFEHNLQPSLIGDCMEDHYLPLLKHFGFSSLSLRNLYIKLLSSEALARNLSSCQILGKLHHDVMHLDRLGQMLVSDLLVNYLVESIDYIEGQKGSTIIWRLPETTYSPNVAVSLSRCYGKQLSYEHMIHGDEGKSAEVSLLHHIISALSMSCKERSKHLSISIC